MLFRGKVIVSLILISLAILAVRFWMVSFVLLIIFGLFKIGFAIWKYKNNVRDMTDLDVLEALSHLLWKTTKEVEAELKTKRIYVGTGDVVFKLGNLVEEGWVEVKAFPVPME